MFKALILIPIIVYNVAIFLLGFAFGRQFEKNRRMEKLIDRSYRG